MLSESQPCSQIKHFFLLLRFFSFLIVFSFSVLATSFPLLSGFLFDFRLRLKLLQPVADGGQLVRAGVGLDVFRVPDGVDVELVVVEEPGVAANRVSVGKRGRTFAAGLPCAFLDFKVRKIFSVFLQKCFRLKDCRPPPVQRSQLDPDDVVGLDRVHPDDLNLF